MQHYGAPTRLLDFSYSKFVAIYFGLKAAYNDIDLEKKQPMHVSFTVWCVDTNDINERAKKYFQQQGLTKKYDARWSITERNDESFEPLYLRNHNVVVSENPARIHERLHLQQGVLFCPGNIDNKFINNLKALYKFEPTDKVKKFICTLNNNEIRNAFELFNRMNITEESLFPGFEGQARSINYKMWLYLKLAKQNGKEIGGN